MSQPLIRVVGLGKSYRTAAGPFPALRGVDLGVDAGEFVAIMGQSGSGKSTFMNLLGCLDTPSSGDYFLAGRNVAHLGDDELAALRNRTLGFVFQGFNLLPRMNLEDNVGLPLVYAGVEREQRRRRARQELQRVGLHAYADSLPSRISGGQQQRVAIGRSLALRPALLLADEPTGNLDEATSDAVLDLMLGLVAETGAALLLVTHSMRIAARLDRRVHLTGGRIA